MRQIILANDKTYSVEWCGVSSNNLSIKLLTDETLLEVATVFSNVENVSTIRYDRGTTDIDTYTGYVNLLSVGYRTWGEPGIIVILDKTSNA